MDLTVEIKIKGFRRPMADVFINPELTAPSATGQLDGGVCQIPMSVDIQRDFAEARLTIWPFAQFVG